MTIPALLLGVVTCVLRDSLTRDSSIPPKGTVHERRPRRCAVSFSLTRSHAGAPCGSRCRQRSWSGRPPRIAGGRGPEEEGRQKEEALPGVHLPGPDRPPPLPDRCPLRKTCCACTAASKTPGSQYASVEGDSNLCTVLCGAGMASDGTVHPKAGSPKPMSVLRAAPNARKSTARSSNRKRSRAGARGRSSGSCHGDSGPSWRLVSTIVVLARPRRTLAWILIGSMPSPAP